MHHTAGTKGQAVTRSEGAESQKQAQKEMSGRAEHRSERRDAGLEHGSPAAGGAAVVHSWYSRHPANLYIVLQTCYLGH